MGYARLKNKASVYTFYKIEEKYMKSFRIFLEGCEAINEAEYNKEWWDSKSDSFKQRYIERHPNSIYAQKASATLNKSADKKPSTSVKSVNTMMKDKSSTSSDFEKAATVLLDRPQKEDAWFRKAIAFAEHPYTPDSVIRRMEKEQPYIALHSPKASQEFLDNQIKNLNPYDAYTWMDVLVQNPSLDTSQRETLSIKLKKALSDVDKKQWHKDSKDFYKERLQWQLEQLLNK